MPLDRDFHTLDEIREAVREAREAREESQADAAKALGVKQPSIAQAEKVGGRGGMIPVLNGLTERYLGVSFSRECFYRIERGGQAGS